jgi:hypothetical protein
MGKKYMGKAHSTNGRDENAYKILIRKPLGTDIRLLK